MSSSLDWRAYVNGEGDFELAFYLFRLNTDLMKEALDLGTLLSDEPAKLRAFKEQIKKYFKSRWLDTAKALEFFDLVVPCSCHANTYCDQCGGSRYLLNQVIAPDKMREIAIVTGFASDTELAAKLQKGLIKALREVDGLSSL